MLTLTYYQTIPCFLDFLFPFGRQEHAKDFHFSGFRHDDRLAEVDRGLQLDPLGRSGRVIRLCYSLRSVESSKGQPDWPWSIRQTAISHNFDIESGQSAWIVIKGNQLIKDRVMSEAVVPTSAQSSSCGSEARNFSLSLSTHLLLCDWAGENWRWYITFLEQDLQKATRHALSIEVAKGSMLALRTVQLSRTQRTSSWWTSRSLPRALTWSSRRGTFQGRNSSTGPAPAPVSISPQEDISNDHEPNGDDLDDSEEAFSFGDLQRTQFIEERANEALLVLTVNIKVLAEMRQHYRLVIDSEDCPNELKVGCRADVARFEKKIASIEHDLRMQQARTESLLRLLADRKSLVRG